MALAALSIGCSGSGVARAASAAGTPSSTPLIETAPGPQTPARGPLDPNAISRPATMDGFPAAHRLSGERALAIARRVGKVGAALRRHPTARPEVFLKGQLRWQVSWFTGGGPRSRSPRTEIAQVYVDDATARVTEAWTGPQVAWTMARGYPGAFGRKVNAPWVWIPLSVLFLLPFLDWRRPLRILHLDLLVLLAFGVSVAFFNDANLDVSVPLVAPLLAYLLVRMLWIGLRPPPVRSPVQRLLVPTAWLGVALVFLIGFRIGLNITSSNVIDVGYSGVIGADRLTHGQRLYGGFPSDNGHGDTYGPVAYEAYVPFEQIFPWHGTWDDLPAAHAAAIAFDLLTMLLLFLIGRRIRGPDLGVVLAYAWAAWPFSLYALNCNTNDALVAALGALALLMAERPMRRGAVAALAGLTKFGSLALIPLLAIHGSERDGRARVVLRFGIAVALTAAIVSLPIVIRGESLHRIYDRTVGFQASRGAPFSIWGLYEHTIPAVLQHLWQALAALLAVVVAFLPRRRNLIRLAALAAAVLIAVQLGLTYWFYLYLVWFFPFAAVALFGRLELSARRS